MFYETLQAPPLAWRPTVELHGAPPSTWSPTVELHGARPQAPLPRAISLLVKLCDMCWSSYVTSYVTCAGQVM